MNNDQAYIGAMHELHTTYDNDSLYLPGVHIEIFKLTKNWRQTRSRHQKAFKILV